MSVLLLDILSRRLPLKALSLVQWDQLLRSAREAEVLGRIAQLRSEQPALEVPPFAHNLLQSVGVQVEAQRRAVRYEVECLEAVFKVSAIPHLYLKGTAYLLAGSANARGRLFSDVDLLVAEAQLEEAECLLRDHGWVSSHANAYDQQYYRRFMHELPPMVHMKRRTVLDLHHNILPRTSRRVPDASRLFASALTLPSGVRVPGPVDLLLHCATHLFHEGEVKQGVRGLVDIDLLFRQLAPEQRLQLFGRAQQLYLERSLYYALHFSQRYLDTPLDEAEQKRLERIKPGLPVRLAMDWLYRSVFEVEADRPRSMRGQLCELLVYLRGHYLRMPLYRLIPHLVRKGLKPKGA
ncbi:nucleotidyltransferase domain-containing protein [Aestuariirhabdus litorea]|uniref:Nucleotidyltransferase family protein n=1 Tax=Aestuariirhabdus litorea TaxID=2528527 RepID=A0A3P3VNQ4_9GAMM|nr:nucleotidyltransferase family protein [Aestuariirhabdus litorea]RRJ84335.1 hypothetical protein D0544_04290 [Aestuariirhabdus litorea]RWW97558.1 hypothetical protein DZC74_04290 [Endozoicomonadaceae bacterium GTF-13]